MSRFSYLSGMLMSGSLCLAVILSACSNKDKAVVQGPVRVDVKVVGNQEAGVPGQNYSGTVEAADASTVSFSVPGAISKIYVSEGQKVKEGQLLAQVESGSLVNSRNIAHAELEEARDAYQRLKKLHDANALPDIKWVEIQAKLKQAENAAALADRGVNDATLRSPINGYISQKFVNEGQTVVPAEPVVKVMNIDKLQVAISVPEDEISLFGATAEATVTFGDNDSLRVHGKMGQKGIVADPLTRSYTVKFDIAEPNERILPGMIGTVSVEGLDKASGVNGSTEIVLPSQAVLLSSDNRQFVWIVKGGKAVRKDVTADELSADGVTVRSGLSAGDSVIVAGMHKVSTGTKVTVIR